MGSSRLLEFLVALIVGGLAVLGALFLIGFLLVEPIRSPPSEEPTRPLEELFSSEGCAPVVSATLLPGGCTMDGRHSVAVASCPRQTCDCDATLVSDSSVCCCRSVGLEALQGIQCPMPGMAPPLSNATLCGCLPCDDLEVTVTLIVVAVATGAPIVAARVFRLDGPGPADLSMLGITNNDGMFRYRETVGAGEVVYKVQAARYLSQYTNSLLMSPARPTVQRRLELVPSVSVEVGLGGAPLTVRLGSTLSVSAGANSFRDIQGEVYTDVVGFEGGVVEVEDEALLPGIPQIPFVYTDPDTGMDVHFSMLLGMELGFTDSAGMPLTNQDGLQVSISIMAQGDQDTNVMLLTFDPFGQRWVKTSDLVPADPFRKKRQTVFPVIFLGQNAPLGFFNIVATGRDVQCWLQTRAFLNDSNTPASNTEITMRQTALLMGNAVLIQFVGETNQVQSNSPDLLVSNAICLPVACTDILESLLVATDVSGLGGNRLLPIEFDDTVFDVGEVAPLVLGSAFLFTNVPLSRPGSPRPFYETLETCRAEGREVVGFPADYFAFMQTDTTNLVEPTDTDSCFIKLLINDCFSGNTVTVTSINPISGEIERTLSMFVGEPVATTMETATDPTTDPGTTGTTADAMTTTDDDMFATTTFSGDGPDDDIVTTTDDIVTTQPPTTTQDPTTQTTQLPTTPAPTTQGPTVPLVCDASTAIVRGVCMPYACGQSVRVLVQTSPESDVPGQFCNVTSHSVLLLGSPFVPDPTEIGQLNFNSVENPRQEELRLALLVGDYNSPELGLYTDAGSGTMSEVFARERCNAGLGEAFSASTIDLTTGYAAIFSCFN